MFSKFVIVGYMASGKSLVGKKLAEKLHLPFVDLDTEIETIEKMSVKEIFQTKGEMYFRKMEAKIFQELLASVTPLVLSTGGGTPCYANSHVLLQSEDVTSVYLKASIETLCHRLKNESHNRPLLFQLDGVTLEEYVAKHLFDRNYYYNHAKYKVSVDDKTPDAIIEEILLKINLK